MLASITMEEMLLPAFTLKNGNHKAVLFDPRSYPMLLGARYVHGGYIAAWYFSDRCLTGRPEKKWNPRQGKGLPEVFEYGLGWSDAVVGDEFLRIGAGRLKKDGHHWMQMDGEPSKTVEWILTDQASDSLSMRCHDEAIIGGMEYRYELERHVKVHSDGVESRTVLSIGCPWSHPVFWFAHPFFAHMDGTGTTLRIPESAEICPDLRSAVDRDDPTRIVTEKNGGFGPITGMWGSVNPIDVELDARLGGGTVRMDVSKPLDKLVVYSTQRVFSVEPYISRAWHEEEAAEWSIRYRFIP